MSNSFQKITKIDPFCDMTLGEWKPDKKLTNKTQLVFSRSAEINIPENYAQDWICPQTFTKKKIWGKALLSEQRVISKENGMESIQRQIEPCIKGGQMKDVI